MSKVICNSTHGCKEAGICGASAPHEYQESECNGCPMDRAARCVEVNPNESDEDNDTM